MARERQVAIVAGAASGIGRAMALGLLEGGIDVAAVDKEPAWLGELKATAVGKAGAPQTIRADPTSFETSVSTVLGSSGRIDSLVNTAGIGQGSISPDQRWAIRFCERCDAPIAIATMPIQPD